MKRQKKPCLFSTEDQEVSHVREDIIADKVSKEVLVECGYKDDVSATPGHCKLCKNKVPYKNWGLFWTHVIRYHYKYLEVKPLGTFKKRMTAASCMKSREARWERLTIGFTTDQHSKLFLPAKYCPEKVKNSRKTCLDCNSGKEQKKEQKKQKKARK